MKIGLFATWLSSSAGGIENMCYNIFIHFKKIYEVQAFSLDVDNEDKFDEHIFYASTSKRTVPIKQFLSAYVKSNRQEHFNLNIAMHVGTGLVTYIIKILYGTPYIVFIHSKEINYFETWIHKFLYNIILCNADSIIANSKYTASLCGKKLKNEIMVIHPGINSDILESAVDIEYRALKEDKLNLFTVSRLVKRKGIDTTIKAVKLLLDSGYPVEYIIAGVGDYEEQLKALVKNFDIGQNVKFLGKISDKEKIERLKRCDLFAMPSYEIPEEGEIEGFGIVYIEANAFGKFVIAGNSGGVPDAVQDGITGYLVDGKDPVAVKNALIKYCEKPLEEKVQLFGCCRKWAEKYSWENIIDILASIISKKTL